MTESILLTQVLSTPADLESVVALRGNSEVTWKDFARRVASWQKAAEQQPAKVVGVFLEDACEFAAVLFGLWYAGKTALLVGDRLPATMAQLQSRAGALAGDFNDSAGLPFIQSSALGAGADVPTFLPLELSHPAVIVLTSGTTGEPKAVPASLSQLSKEVFIHENHWGRTAGQSAVIGTVSHQHIYGLLWRVLWPLAGRRPFVAETCQYAESVLALAEQLPSAVLVTTPTHLARWPHQPGETAVGKWSLVVSSTAPLSREHSAFGSDYFGVPVTEIFGSSETGGIAWRQQINDEIWTALKGIEVRTQPETGALQLQSPILDSDDWIMTGDQAEAYDTRRFRLLGRLDRIAKVEGKRVSLTNMELELTKHPHIEDVRVVVLNGRRTEAAVVAVLSELGRQRFASAGKRALTTELRQWLASHFETPVLPRRWRLVGEFPRNAQGKIPQQDLMALFEQTEQEHSSSNGSDSNHWPIVIKRELLDANTARLHLGLSPDLIYFRGHFDEFPVLPGVVQIHWVEHFARSMFEQRLAGRSAFSRMEAVKFQELLQPGRKFAMDISLQPERSRIVFRLHDGDIVFSSGRLVFDAAQGPIDA